MSLSPPVHIALPFIAGACLLAAGARASAEAPNPVPADAPVDPSDAGVSTPSSSEPDPSVSVGDAAPPTPRSAPPSDLPLVLMLTAASDTGTLPRTAFGVGGGVGLEAKPFRIEATLAYWPSVSSNLAATPSTGGSFTMVVTVIRGCALAEVSLLSLGGCAGWSLTNMQADTFDATTSSSASAAWSSFVADALVLGRIVKPFSLRLSVGTAAPFSRPTFAVGTTAVHQPASASLDLALGVETQF